MRLWRCVEAVMNDESNRNVKGKVETANLVSHTKGKQKGKVKDVPGNFMEEGKMYRVIGWTQKFEKLNVRMVHCNWAATNVLVN